MRISFSSIITRYAKRGFALLALILTTFSIHSLARRMVPDEKSAQQAVVRDYRATTLEGQPSQDGFNRPSKVKKICFSRAGSVYVMETATGTIVRLEKGDEPSLSPAGNEIALVLTQDGDEPSSTLKILSSKSGEVREFSSLLGVPSHNPQWAPDGKKIAFEYKSGLYWVAGLLDPKTNEWHSLSRKLPAGNNYFVSSWLADGKSVLLQDLKRLYEIDLEGNEVQTILIEKMLPANGSITSSSRFSFSHDKRRLLFDAVDPNLNGAVYIYDLEKKSLSRITPQTVSGGEPLWLPSETEVLFAQLTKSDPPFEYSISKISLVGDNLEVLVRNAEHISYSR